MPLRFRAQADRHGVPRRSTWHVAMTTKSVPVITNWGEAGNLFVGIDDRGIELEVITVTRHGQEVVVHSMPTAHRHDTSRS